MVAVERGSAAIVPVLVVGSDRDYAAAADQTPS
jgi:hypothetical protein